MQFSSQALPNEQRWDQLDAPGPASFYRNMGNGECLRANPNNNILVRTAPCDFSGTSAASKQQQWILSGTGQFASLDRFARGVSADSLRVDFANINRVVGIAPFSGGADMRWSVLPG
jgi:hypothetical protein